MTKDCPITVDDIDNALAIFGKDITAVKGKTTRSKPIHMVVHHLKMPKGTMNEHRNVSLTAETFFGNEMPFFLTSARKIDCTSVQKLNSRKALTVFKAFHSIYRFHRQQNFFVVTASVNGEF